MDELTRLLTAVAGPAGSEMVPPEQPLPHPRQSLRHVPDEGRCAAPIRQRARAWRAMTFLPALLTTGLLCTFFGRWLAEDGLGVAEAALVALVCATFFWIAMSLATATVGFLHLLTAPPLRTRAADPAPRGIDVALLVPIYNEVPWDVMGNAAAMLDELGRSETPHTFSLFVLSDTRDPVIAAQEWRAAELLAEALPEGRRFYYRRRPENTDRKSGNIADWVARWGGGHEAMVVLDADSLMSGKALTSLACEMAADPSAGLIQSFPRLIGARTFFARVQQFSSVVYGALLAEGLATWTDTDGNYWGHNAIIRTAAFASCAGLPRMPALRGEGGLIMSHDFVEAGLLRRAGWSIRFLPRIDGSYEESPASLIDFCLRDRRWCHGNLQHILVLATSRLAGVSRFHLFSGAMAYLMSPAWFVLLCIWALLGTGQTSLVQYFSPENPMRPLWPELSPLDNVLVLVFMYSMLLAPKALGALSLPLTGIRPAHFGRRRFFWLSICLEVAASVAFAPILMVQQMIAVLRTIAGVSATWSPQARSGGNYGLAVLLRFHALETVTGILLVSGMATGLVSLWLLPIAASLLLAVPISALSSVDLAQRRWTDVWLRTPESVREPGIISSARTRREELRRTLAEPGTV
ncbi:glucans biosynthesis glucosyltransferase MdoH [Roseicyclus sp. F158]|uniref:Glucans biosynthesis glucosyltransferase H n=1 Tax=Tropicimonas omnivorans TaxID=3075590 RepID=A0ABU3DDX8_9RHOB|nr:glucans biosynthesis glucosyltransferase MdoH [Roseicyclus sp. F158]MDT0681925.1 glucans biosynthesis glucosyltransferase MdoH [Roseicyclus sp. F158]